MNLEGARGVVAAALAVSLGLVAAKLWATYQIGSSVMLSTLVHSLIDASAQALLWLGLARNEPNGARPALIDGARDIGFWSYVVAIPLYAMGAGVVLYEGVTQLTRPLATTGSRIELGVAGVAAAMAVGVAWLVWRRLEITRSGRKPLVETLRRARNAPLLTILIQSIAAYTGALIALCGIVASRHAGVAAADGAAAVATGLVLISVAAAMAVEVRRLLVTASPASAERGHRQSESAAAPIASPAPERKSLEAVPDTMPLQANAAPSTMLAETSSGAAGKPQIMTRPRTARKGHGKRRR